MSILFGELLTLLLVFVRMSGIMLTNPLFTRSNIPMQLRMTIIFALSLLLSTAMDGVAISELSSVEYVMAVFREILTGITIGMVFQLFITCSSVLVILSILISDSLCPRSLIPAQTFRCRFLVHF